mgnify:CR=1 FL=1
MSDDVIFMGNLNDDDDDSTVFQSEEERKKLEQEIQQENEDDSDFEITQNMESRPCSFWRQSFG